MAKYYGKVGYAETVETRPGVWEEVITRREYFGDILKNTSRYENSGNLNDNINFSNRISIVADPFAYQNFNKIRYIEYLGSKWKVSSVEVAFPRLILTMGGEYVDSE